MGSCEAIGSATGGGGGPVGGVDVGGGLGAALAGGAEVDRPASFVSIASAQNRKCGRASVGEAVRRRREASSGPAPLRAVFIYCLLHDRRRQPRPTTIEGKA